MILSLRERLHSYSFCSSPWPLRSAAEPGAVVRSTSPLQERPACASAHTHEPDAGEGSFSLGDSDDGRVPG